MINKVKKLDGYYYRLLWVAPNRRRRRWWHTKSVSHMMDDLWALECRELDRVCQVANKVLDGLKDSADVMEAHWQLWVHLSQVMKGNAAPWQPLLVRLRRCDSIQWELQDQNGYPYIHYMLERREVKKHED